MLDDADLASTIESFFAATLLNNGQICWLGTRILAPQNRYSEIVDTITGLVDSLQVGDALDPATQIGPLVSDAQRRRVEGYIEKGKADGARLTSGGGRPEGLDAGWFVDPTVFADVDNASTIAQEEIFGPVLLVIPYRDEDEAVTITKRQRLRSRWFDLDQRPRPRYSGPAPDRLRNHGVNGYMNDPTAPFGGVKASGLGREMGPEGRHAFQVLKTIYLDPRASS